ncbi:hypothetical protein UJ101_01339 [Flavobacteriaceae bacterium UJ101]|nr:hypothetical protein UJ101_01339 [Flavobacteriaceae bacterium UJ101]
MKKINRILMKKQLMYSLLIVCGMLRILGQEITDPAAFQAMSGTTTLSSKDGAIYLSGSFPNARSTAIYSQNTSIYIEFKAGDDITKGERMRQHIGFTNDGPYAYRGFLLHKDSNQVDLVEGSTTIQNLGTYNPGDIFRIEKKDNTVSYIQNGVVLFEEVFSLNDFRIGIASSDTNGYIEGIKLGTPTDSFYSVSMEEARINKLKVNTDTLPDGYQVAVKGEMIIEGIMIKDFTSWPDYVFEENYPLKDLKVLEKEIQHLGHLPNVPSAKKVLKEGVDLGDMNVILLEKIEELTLYTIQQQKLFEKQQEELNQLMDEIEKKNIKKQ